MSAVTEPLATADKILIASSFFLVASQLSGKNELRKPHMDWLKLKAGDKAAWDESIDALVTFAKNTARLRCPGLSAEEQQIAANQAVILLVNRIDKVEEIDSEESLHRWLFRCAKRRAIDLLRKGGRLKSKVVSQADSLDFEREEGIDRADETSPIPYEEAAHAELCTVAADVLGQLESNDAELLRERYLLQWSQAEIAQKHGWETSSVGNRINQALNRARKLLASDPRLAEICSQP